MLRYLLLAIFWMGLSTPLVLQQSAADDAVTDDGMATFDKETVLDEASSYFGAGAEGIASIIEKVFSERDLEAESVLNQVSSAHAEVERAEEAANRAYDTASQAKNR